MCIRDRLYIDDLCVDKEQRGKHIGEALFDYVKKEAKRMEINGEQEKKDRKTSDGNGPSRGATLTARRHAEKALIDRDMMKYFEFMLTIEDVGVPKYEPDIYLEAARRLGLTAEECMVFEDAPYAGVTAKKAGFALCGMAEPAYAEGEDTLRQVSDVFVEHSFAELADKL